ncbi:MAG: hypothetical protein V1929_00220 [bacterium]
MIQALLYFLLFVASIMITISPIFIWNEVQKIRMKSDDMAAKTDELLVVMKKIQSAAERSASAIASISHVQPVAAPKSAVSTQAATPLQSDRRVIEIPEPPSAST